MKGVQGLNGIVGETGEQGMFGVIGVTGSIGDLYVSGSYYPLDIVRPIKEDVLVEEKVERLVPDGDGFWDDDIYGNKDGSFDVIDLGD